LVIFGDISMRVIKRLDFFIVNGNDGGQDIISTVVGLDEEERFVHKRDVS
jgi:hypothetical protein